ncbi:hypothetical protein ZIOFF_001270 [Zingiber officinale]|uniref:Uncharacterized protein n=1 Tax=Zingiber officinale TaxID=94328 RepID=A0A8J5M7B1_ZINOF|nr:hypothetical protein ZIOFF_001270 [Zingiber officinale]
MTKPNMPSTIIITHPHHLQFAMAFSASLFYPPLSYQNAPSPLLFCRPHSIYLLACCSSATTFASFDLRTYWTTMISEIEEVFDATVPVQYPESIHKVIDHVVLSPGAKHALPIMCIASREFVGLRSTGFPIACALEMVHAASLVHDNLPCMDASPLRHGYPFAHALLGIDMVVITNDPLFPLVYKHIVTHTPSPDPIPLSIIPLILTEITRAIDCIGINGVASLNNCPGLKMLSPPSIARLKPKITGHCLLGTTAGSEKEILEELEALQCYGQVVGVFYQLVDDVLMESNDNTGKMRSNVSIIKVVRMDCRLELVEEVRAKAKKELEKFKDKYGEKVLPLYSFVDYAIESCFMVKAGALNPFQL